MNYLLFLGSDAILWLAICAVIINGFLWFFLYQRERHLRRSEKRLAKHLEKISTDAQERSLGIIERAEEKASRIIGETDFVTDKVKEDLEASLEKVLKSNEVKIERFLERLDDANRRVVSNLQEELTRRTDREMSRIIVENEKEVKAMVRRLEESTLASHTDLRKSVEAEYDKAREDAKQYRLDQIAKIDRSLDKIVLDLSTEFFGKIPLEAQEKLVFETLEKAKKELVV